MAEGGRGPAGVVRRVQARVGGRLRRRVVDVGVRRIAALDDDRIDAQGRRPVEEDAVERRHLHGVPAGAVIDHGDRRLKVRRRPGAGVVERVGAGRRGVDLDGDVAHVRDARCAQIVARRIAWDDRRGDGAGARGRSPDQQRDGDQPGQAPLPHGPPSSRGLGGWHVPSPPTRRFRGHRWRERAGSPMPAPGEHLPVSCVRLWPGTAIRRSTG